MFLSLTRYLLENLQLSNATFKRQTLDIVEGPTEVAKKTGFLRDEDLSFWGTEDSFHKLKTKFKLIPGIDKERPIWQLAVPRYGLSEEAIMACKPVTDVETSWLIRANVFRTIWDLGFGTERLKELQIPILRSVIDGIRS